MSTVLDTPLVPPPEAVAPPQQPQPAPPPPVEPERVLLHMPVDVRSLALAVLAVLGTLVFLRWAAALLVPLMLGLMLSYALDPLVDRLERWRIPRAAAAAMLLAALGAGAGASGYALRDDAAALLDSLPQAVQKVRDTVRARQGRSESAIDKVQRAAVQLEQAAQQSIHPAPPAQGVTRVHVERGPLDVRAFLWTGTLGLAASAAQAAVVFFLAFFLLISGTTFRRKLVRIAGPTFTQKRITVQALDEITAQIQRFLLVQVLLSALVGVATWLAFLALGLDQAAVWGVAAFALNFIPYIGFLVFTALSALVAFVQFGSFDMALAVAGVSLVLHTISGNLLMPWLTSRANQMNAVAVFTAVLAFGWLWGVWGLLLGVPIVAAIKAVCDRVDDLKPLGELLGR